MLESSRFEYEPYSGPFLSPPSLHCVGTLGPGLELNVDRFKKDPLLLLPV